MTALDAAGFTDLPSVVRRLASSSATASSTPSSASSFTPTSWRPSRRRNCRASAFSSRSRRRSRARAGTGGSSDSCSAGRRRWSSRPPRSPRPPRRGPEYRRSKSQVIPNAIDPDAFVRSDVPQHQLAALPRRFHRAPRPDQAGALASERVARSSQRRRRGWSTCTSTAMGRSAIHPVEDH